MRSYTQERTTLPYCIYISFYKQVPTHKLDFVRVHFARDLDSRHKHAQDSICNSIHRFRYKTRYNLKIHGYDVSERKDPKDLRALSCKQNLLEILPRRELRLVQSGLELRPFDFSTNAVNETREKLAVDYDYSCVVFKERSISRDYIILHCTLSREAYISVRKLKKYK